MKGLPTVIAFNFCLKIQGRAGMRASLRLKQVKARTSRTTSVYGRAQERGGPRLPSGGTPLPAWWIQEGFLEDVTLNLSSEGPRVLGLEEWN